VEEIAIAPFGDGRFEVFVDGTLVYSKLETGDFPDDDTLVTKIRKSTR
jgi:selT/selW/selH-like putative selenoprotein